MILRGQPQNNDSGDRGKTFMSHYNVNNKYSEIAVLTVKKDEIYEWK